MENLVIQRKVNLLYSKKKRIRLEKETPEPGKTIIRVLTAHCPNRCSQALIKDMGMIGGSAVPAKLPYHSTLLTGKFLEVIAHDGHK